MLVLGLVYYCE